MAGPHEGIALERERNGGGGVDAESFCSEDWPEIYLHWSSKNLIVKIS